MRFSSNFYRCINLPQALWGRFSKRTPYRPHFNQSKSDLISPDAFLISSSKITSYFHDGDMVCEYAYFTFPDCGCPALVPLRFCPHHVDKDSPIYNPNDEAAHAKAIRNPARIHMLFKGPANPLSNQDFVRMADKFEDPLLRGKLKKDINDEKKRKAWRHFGKEIRRMQMPKLDFAPGQQLKGLEPVPTMGFHTKLCTYNLVYPDCEYLEIWRPNDEFFPFFERSCIAHDGSVREDNSKKGWGIYPQEVYQTFQGSYEARYAQEKSRRSAAQNVNSHAIQADGTSQDDRDDFSDFTDEESYKYIEKISLSQTMVDKAIEDADADMSTDQPTPDTKKPKSPLAEKKRKKQNRHIRFEDDDEYRPSGGEETPELQEQRKKRKPANQQDPPPPSEDKKKKKRRQTDDSDGSWRGSDTSSSDSTEEAPAAAAVRQEIERSNAEKDAEENENQNTEPTVTTKKNKKKPIPIVALTEEDHSETSGSDPEAPKLVKPPTRRRRVVRNYVDDGGYVPSPFSGEESAYSDSPADEYTVRRPAKKRANKAKVNKKRRRRFDDDNDDSDFEASSDNDDEEPSRHRRRPVNKRKVLKDAGLRVALGKPMKAGDSREERDEMITDTESDEASTGEENEQNE